MALYNYLGTELYDGLPSVNVKAFGAKGDGETADSDAIQDALDSVNLTGGIIVFPTGTYMIDKSLKFYSNQLLFFEPCAVLQLGANIDNLMRSYTTSTIGSYDGVHDTQIIGAVFDAGSITGNLTLLGFCHAKNITIKNCKFINESGGWHELEINSSMNILIDNCEFDGSKKNNSNGENIQIDHAGSSAQYPWDSYKTDSTVCNFVEIRSCYFYNNTYSPAIGNHTNGAHKFTRIHDCVFDSYTGSRGAIDFTSSMSEVDIYDNTFNGCTTGIGSYGATYYIHDNRFVSATTAISGSTSIAHANIINGTYTA